MLAFKRLLVEYRNDCFRASYECLCELARRGVHAQAVHGRIMHGEDIRLRLVHSWVEVADNVYDWSSGIEESIPRDVYYELVRAEPMARYNLVELMQEIESSGHYGPWHSDLMTVVKKGDTQDG